MLTVEEKTKLESQVGFMGNIYMMPPLILFCGGGGVEKSICTVIKDFKAHLNSKVKGS
jgi:hypothetical protein